MKDLRDISILSGHDHSFPSSHSIRCWTHDPFLFLLFLLFLLSLLFLLFLLSFFLVWVDVLSIERFDWALAPWRWNHSSLVHIQESCINSFFKGHTLAFRKVQKQYGNPMLSHAVPCLIYSIFILISIAPHRLLRFTFGRSFFGYVKSPSGWLSTRSHRLN